MATLMKTVLFYCLVIALGQCFEYKPPTFVGSCPEISSYGPEDNDDQGIKHWHNVYSSAEDLLQYNCIHGNVTKLGNGKCKIDTVLSNSTGYEFHFTSEVEKIGDGKYVSTFHLPSENKTVQSDVRAMKEGKFLMIWACRNLENNTYSECASVYSDDTEVPEETVHKFLTYLKDSGSQIGHFHKMNNDNCHSE